MTPSTTCYHEAGHAVAAHLLGAQILCAEAGERGGLTTWSHHADGSPMRQLVVAVAGEAAEIYHAFGPHPTREQLESAPDRCSAMDMKHASEAARALAAEWPGDTAWCEAYRRAGRLLRQSWSAVEAVALALAERGRLDGPQVRGLIDGAEMKRMHEQFLRDHGHQFKTVRYQLFDVEEPE